MTLPETVSVNVPAVGVNARDTRLPAPVPTSGPAVDVPESVIVPVPVNDRTCCTLVTVTFCVESVSVFSRRFLRPVIGTMQYVGLLAVVDCTAWLPGSSRTEMLSYLTSNPEVPSLMERVMWEVLPDATKNPPTVTVPESGLKEINSVPPAVLPTEIVPLDVTCLDVPTI